MSPLLPISLCKVIGDGRRLFSAALLHDKHSGAQTQTIRRHPLPNKHPDYTKRQARGLAFFLVQSLPAFNRGRFRLRRSRRSGRDTAA